MMKKLLLALVLIAPFHVMACDYEYTTDAGNEVCANSGDQDVTLTTSDGEEQDGHWVGNGLIENDATGEQEEVDQ